MRDDASPFGPEIVVVILVVGGLVAFVFVYAAGKLFRQIDSRFSPVKYVRELIYFELPMEISSPLSATLVQERLRGAISRFAVPLLMSERLVGVLTRGVLRVRVHRPFFSNSFAPVFVGTITQTDNRTEIRGVFRHSVFTRVFMTLCFGFLAAWSVIGIPAGLIMLIFGEGEGAVYVLAPIIMFGFGILLLKLGGISGAKDHDLIRKKIANTIGGVVA